MLELSLQTSFTTFCSIGIHYGTSSAINLLVENRNSTSLLEIQGNNSISGSAFKNESKAERQKWVAPGKRGYYLLVIITSKKCVVLKEK